MDLTELFSNRETVELAVRNDHEQFGDDPDTIRWRAWWDKDYSGNVMGIKVQAYPVARLTPKGAWIDPRGYYSHDGWSKAYKESLRWVSNDGGAAWAKRTRAEALESLAIRHQRWAGRLMGDIGYFIEASKAMRALMPERAEQAKSALANMVAYMAGNTDA